MTKRTLNNKNYYFYGLILLINSFYITPVQALSADRIQQLEWNKIWQQDVWRPLAVKYPYHHCFRKAAMRNNLPTAFVIAVARGESNFDVNAISHKNAYGLMQIQWPQTAHELGIYRRSDLTEKPCLNIMAGANYLRMLLDRYDQDIHRAVAAYNYGPGRIPTGDFYSDLPEGAQWYSRYILRHLSKIIAKRQDKTSPYNRRPSNRYNHVVIRFQQESKARKLAIQLRKILPKQTFIFAEVTSEEYAVIAQYSNLFDKKQGTSTLQKLGFNPVSSGL